MRRRIALSTALAALVSLLAAGLVSIGLVRTSYDAQAAASLHREAVLLSNINELTRPRLSGVQRRVGNQLDLLIARVSPAGVTTGSGRSLLTPELTSAAQASHALAGQRSINGHRYLVDVEPTDSGGVVVFQALSDARAATSHVFRRLLLAALIGLAVAVAIGVALARRLSRPLVEAADAAHRLAYGERSIRLSEEGPDELAEVSRSINRLAQSLTYSEGREREFLLSVSHELKTPLTGIRGFAEALTEGVATPEEAGRTIEAEATRMQRLVADLLDLARAGADDFRLDLADTDLTALVVDAGAVWERRCSDVGVRLIVDVPGHPVIVRTDGGRIRQILDGLAENALRVTPEGQVIVFAVDSSGLVVRDGGPGLTEADLPVAFERSVLYERYRGVRQVGTGLGLALVARLAQRLGATVEAGHAPEGGASFGVRFSGARS